MSYPLLLILPVSFVDIDATGEPESGILLGNMAWLGSYKECVVIPEAHYCLATFLVNITNVVSLRI